jgi:transmembrane sensor
MNKKTNIEYLLQKFKSGALSPEEAKDLLLQVKEGDENTSLKSLLDNYWADSDSEIPEKTSIRTLGGLKRKLNISQGNYMKKKHNQKVALIMLLRYAAIFVSATCFAWLAKDYIDNKHLVSDPAHNLKDTEISVSYGSKSRIVLPDGTIVNLNSGSYLKYSGNFSPNIRNVYIEGEAFFDVVKDPQHPFYVRTDEITVKVLGTKFNIKSYPEEKTIQTTLVSGSLEIYSNIKKNKQPIITLAPKQQAIVDKETESITSGQTKATLNKTDLIAPRLVSIESTMDMNQAIAWKDNRLTFRDESFKELSRKMERWYNVIIEIKYNELAQKQFSGIFVNESVEQALNALKMVTPFEYKMEKNYILITK